jgi:hypothetical protein
MNKPRQPATQKRGAPLRHNKWDIPSLTDRDPAIVPDPDGLLRVLQELAATNPYWTWQAILVCRTHEKEFPKWVIDYLGRCAVRMILADRDDRDLRDKLLTIFDFPKKKPGPGNPLDPRDEALKAAQKLQFAATFAVELFRVESPVQARRNAGDKVFGKAGDKEIDDRTLRKYLEEEFGSLPATKQKWQWVIARWVNDMLPPEIWNNDMLPLAITKTESRETMSRYSRLLGYTTDRIARVGIPHRAKTGRDPWRDVRASTRHDARQCNATPSNATRSKEKPDEVLSRWGRPWRLFY